MVKNKIYSKYGLSLVCLLSVIGGGAYATEVTNGFSFVIPNIQGAAGCAPTVNKNANNCTVVQPTARANGTGECQATGDPQIICPGAPGTPGTSCTTSAERVDTGVRVTTQCGDDDPQTEIVNDGISPTIDYETITNTVSQNMAGTYASKEDIAGFQTASDVSTAISSATSGFASKTNIPVMDTTTGGMSWVDPTTGNTIHYGQYTFITFGSYNKKMNNKWFKCTKFKTDVPTTTLVQQHIENVQCNSGDGWNYGTDCLLDGSITSYASPLPQGLENWNWKYNLCQIIKSGDAITMIEETVADKGYLTSGTVRTALGLGANATVATTDLIPSDSHIKDAIATVGYAMDTDLQTLQQTVTDGLAARPTQDEVTSMVNSSKLCQGDIRVERTAVEGANRFSVYCVTVTNE